MPRSILFVSEDAEDCPFTNNFITTKIVCNQVHEECIKLFLLLNLMLGIMVRQYEQQHYFIMRLFLVIHYNDYYPFQNRRGVSTFWITRERKQLHSKKNKVYYRTFLISVGCKKVRYQKYETVMVRYETMFRVRVRVTLFSNIVNSFRFAHFHSVLLIKWKWLYSRPNPNPNSKDRTWTLKTEREL